MIEKKENFKNWFGDWQDSRAHSSKWPADKPHVSSVINRDGSPMVVYHATHGDFNEFEMERETINSTNFGDISIKRHGLFFSEDVKFAEDYLKKSPGANIVPVYLNIKCPADITEGLSGEIIQDILDNSEGLRHSDFYHIRPHDMWSLFDDDFGQKVVEALKKAGYDGVLMLENGHSDDDMHSVWVAFDPRQIKSALGNSGAFDPQSSDITDRIKSAQNALDFLKSLDQKSLAPHA